jgi:hypothetical protein
MLALLTPARKPRWLAPLVGLKHESRSFSKPLWESTDWNDLDMPWPVTSVSLIAAPSKIVSSGIT